MVGSASEYNQHGEHLDHTGRPYAAGSPDPRTRPAVFVDKGQQPHPCAVIEPQMHEVVDPHMLLPRRPQTHSRAVIEPQTPSLGLLHRHLQPFPSPYPLHTPVVHMPAAMPQKGGDPTVAVPAELTGQLHDPLGQGILILIGDRLISPCGRRMTRHTAGASPRNPKERLHMVETPATTRRTQNSPPDASRRIWLPGVRSATALFRRPFSNSRRFRRLAWSILRPPYSLRQL